MKPGPQRVDRAKLGKLGEKLAVATLKGSGLRILARNYRCPVGEIDIIALDTSRANVDCETICFVEVKTRKNEDFGRPISAVNKAKRHRLSRAAVGYLKRQKPPPDYFRFDVVEVIGEPDMGPPIIRHIENAFQLDSIYKLWW